MEITVQGTDPFGNEEYETLFRNIMNDMGEAMAIERAHLVLKAEIPLFVFSVRLKSEPENRTISDVASIRSEGDGIHITITDERYAPEILDNMWAMYGRESVDQQTRFDMSVSGAKMDEVANTVVASGEETLREVIGTIWRSMPEGIRVRESFITGTVLTVVATEEIMLPEYRKEGVDVHVMMGGSPDV